ncbi:MAG: 16S rRNA (guanine(966)-N(2))-methyltransferase RsmD [Planctomycetaceae bacterium]
MAADVQLRTALVRIIAGQFRRRKLLSNPGSTTRPLTDRAKEVLFERLAGDIEGKRIADVFAGTGTIGLEALSRGAIGVVFVENDRRAVELLRKNVHALGAEDQTLCWATDATRCSYRPQGVDHLLPFDTVFVDPPYRMIARLRAGTPMFRSLERLLRDGVTGERALLVLRTPQDAEFEVPPGWRLDRTLDIRSMAIHLFDKDVVVADPSP